MKGNLNYCLVYICNRCVKILGLRGEKNPKQNHFSFNMKLSNGCMEELCNIYSMDSVRMDHITALLQKKTEMASEFENGITDAAS